MKYVLALDQGTTSSRAILFDAEGRRVATAQRELPQYFPQPGWVEHDPEEIWQTQLDCAREALAQSRIAIDALLAIGIANQRETTLLWERATGRPLSRAIVWQDRRTADRCAQLAAAGHEALFRKRVFASVDARINEQALHAGQRVVCERGQCTDAPEIAQRAAQINRIDLIEHANRERIGVARRFRGQHGNLPSLQRAC